MMILAEARLMFWQNATEGKNENSYNKKRGSPPPPSHAGQSNEEARVEDALQCLLRAFLGSSACFPLFTPKPSASLSAARKARFAH